PPFSLSPSRDLCLAPLAHLAHPRSGGPKRPLFALGGPHGSHYTALDHVPTGDHSAAKRCVKENSSTSHCPSLLCLCRAHCISLSLSLPASLSCFPAL